MTGRREVVALALLGGLARSASFASELSRVPPEIAATLPGAREQGSATLRFFGMRVYDARLWTAAGSPPIARWPQDAATPLALEIEYFRSLSGGLIADRSLVEMRRQREIAAAVADRWLAALKAIVPDVAAGDRVTAINLGGSGVRFHVNGKPAGEIADAGFASLFFGIWLSPQTSEPALRTALLGAGSR